MDEACQATELSTLIPLATVRPKNCILVGDPHQLPPTVFSTREEEGEKNSTSTTSAVSDLLSRATTGSSPNLQYNSQNHLTFPSFVSLFDRLSNAITEAKVVATQRGLATMGHSLLQQPLFLNIQYRMHPIISKFPRSEFYQKVLQDDFRAIESLYPAHGKLSVSDVVKDTIRNYVILDAGVDKGNSNSVHSQEEKGAEKEGEGQNNSSSRKTSFRNLREVQMVRETVAFLLKHKPWTEILVIMPYKNQQIAIEAALVKKINFWY